MTIWRSPAGRLDISNEQTDGIGNGDPFACTAQRVALRADVRVTVSVGPTVLGAVDQLLGVGDHPAIFLTDLFADKVMIVMAYMIILVL